MLFYIWLQVYKVATTARNQNYAWTDFEKKETVKQCGFSLPVETPYAISEF